MNYLNNRAAYYTLFVAELTGRAAENVFAVIAPIFLIKKRDKRMRELLTDPTFGSLTTTVAATVYGNYVRAFCTDPSAYGKKADEAEMLELKKGVLQALDEFKKSPALNPLVALAENHEKLKLSVVYALALYVCNSSASKTYLRVLQRAVTDADGMDACIALMYFEQDRAAERYAQLKYNASFELYPELATTLVKQYKIDASAVACAANKTVWG